jgi:hypothetical protein
VKAIDTYGQRNKGECEPELPAKNVFHDCEYSSDSNEALMEFKNNTLPSKRLIPFSAAQFRVVGIAPF